MNRKDRRALQFGHFSPNRGTYQPVDMPQGIELDMDNTLWEDHNRLWQHDYRSPEFCKLQAQRDPRFEGLGAVVDRFDYFMGL